MGHLPARILNLGITRVYCGTTLPDGRKGMAFYWRSAHYKLRRFVRKHERWLTFAGAFIVVMTFIVKEGLREKWRDTSAAIERVQSIYITASRFDELTASFDHLRYTVRGYAAKGDYFTQDFEQLMEKNTSVAHTLASIEVILQELPEDKGDDWRVAQPSADTTTQWVPHPSRTLRRVGGSLIAPSKLVDPNPNRQFA